MAAVNRATRSRLQRRLSLAGALVVQARRDVGLSQREMARRAGVSRTTVAEIEAGTRDPGLNTLRAVVRGAGFDLDLRLVARDDHDEVLAKFLDRLPASERLRMEQGFDRFLKGLADGLATSRPLLARDE